MRKWSFSWVSELLVLGCHVDGSGSTETLVQKRLEQGRKMFIRTRSLLSCPKIPEEERLRTFYSTVVPCVLWGSGCWVSVGKNSAAPFVPRKTGGFVVCWVVERPKMWHGLTGFVQRNVRHMR